MPDIKEKIAFVTGAASGIGFALCAALLEKGAKVMMADIDETRLKDAQKQLNSPDDTAITLCDVANAASVHAAANATIDRFGKIHLVFNNAGVSLGGRPGKIALDDWRWITDINLMGLVHGCETFIPLLIRQGEGGHIVNTASMAGHVTSIGMGPYFATKFAAVGYSEALHQELSSVGIGVSCLCPTWVKSNIHNTAESSPSVQTANLEEPAFKNTTAYQAVKALVENGMDASRYASLTMTAIEQNRLHVFNDPVARQEIVNRHTRLLADYDACLNDLDLSSNT